MKTHRRIDVTLTLLGPILTRGGHSPEPGIDAPMARDAQDRFMLPFSLIKGKVLDAFRELRPANDPQVQDWLGRTSGDANHEYAPERGRLRFGDFATTQVGTNADGVIERIQIDPATGSTAGRMLAMLEAPFGYGEEVAFAGTIEFIADDAEAETIRAALEDALRWVPAYGSLRTVGFGRTKQVEAVLSTAATTSTNRPKAGASLPFRLIPDRPLCLVGKKHSHNHFESLDSISGAVLKGATARLILELDGTPNTIAVTPSESSRFKSVRRHFETLRFNEARPMRADADRRPVEPPLSVVTSPVESEKGKWYDVAMLPEAKLIAGAAPAFASDWKPKVDASVRGRFGCSDLPRERRTRTSIDADTGRAAESLLFSYGLVLPERDGKSFVWETVIGLEGVPESERAAVTRELGELFAHGLPNIGKTRAVGAVTWLPKRTEPTVGTKPIATGERIVTLQTDCLMTNPELLKDGGPLKAAYEDFWTEVSGGALELVRFFAKQSLHGGYLSKRFGKAGYEPYLVTDRGSVFVLKANDSEKADDLLERWGEEGLPPPAWVEKRYGLDGKPLWATCPFLREVGFGEVAIDLNCHTKVPT